MLRPIADEIWLVPVSGERGASIEELRPAAEAAGFKLVQEAEVPAALAAARRADGPVLVTGSLFLAGEVLALLAGAPKPLATAQ